MPKSACVRSFGYQLSCDLPIRDRNLAGRNLYAVQPVQIRNEVVTCSGKYSPTPSVTTTVTSEIGFRLEHFENLNRATPPGR